MTDRRTPGAHGESVTVGLLRKFCHAVLRDASTYNSMIREETKAIFLIIFIFLAVEAIILILLINRFIISMVFINDIINLFITLYFPYQNAFMFYLM